MKAIRSLVLLAADKEVRLLSNTGVGHGLTDIARYTGEDFPDTDIEFTDRPTLESGHGRAMHASEPRHTEAEIERTRMVAHAIALTEAEWAKGYDRLYMSAPDKVLGLLRDRLPRALRDAVAGDLDKDLVKVSTRDLPAHFAAFAAF